MQKMIIFIFLATIVWQINAQKLSGADFAKAVDILKSGLSQLSEKDGPSFTLSGVEVAFKFIPHIIYNFDTELLLPTGNFDLCTVEVSLSQLNDKQTLVVINCSGQEMVRKVIPGTIEI
ncbi:hypothetical protein FF38_12525 [Lucilia cuprina]|uniref:Uncharacterized protein n=1 Tax=Lucilia cuprina TaxID=7375 RepID=A0A0L0BN28_LUCCU|nr:hypothetical protein CVS40_0862 [Lucilia cuprina]KNC21426.1 hypothetical protein FF38_12525 [Lucilia cuprina]